MQLLLSDEDTLCNNISNTLNKYQTEDWLRKHIAYKDERESFHSPDWTILSHFTPLKYGTSETTSFYIDDNNDVVMWSLTPEITLLMEEGETIPEWVEFKSKFKPDNNQTLYLVVHEIKEDGIFYIETKQYRIPINSI